MSRSNLRPEDHAHAYEMGGVVYLVVPTYETDAEEALSPDAARLLALRLLRLADQAEED